MIGWVALALASGVLAYWGTGQLGRVLTARQMLDHPNARSSHQVPTPRGGGLLIAGITLLGLVGLEITRRPVAWIQMLAYLAGAVLIAVVSALDDLHSVANRIRFGVHLLGAALAVWGFGFWRMVEVPLLGRVALGYVGLPLTLLWIVGLTNAYNFMDGIDGLAAGQAIIAGLGWAVIGWWHGWLLVESAGLLIAAMSTGFLGHNWAPARIFMGDVGSSFLGYSFAVLPLLASAADPRLFVVAPLLVWPFLFDAIFTFLRRLRHGEAVWEAHRSHLYQRLVISGERHAAVTSLYLGLAVVGTGGAWWWEAGTRGAGLAMIVVIAGLAGGLWGYVVYREHRRPARVTTGPTTH